MTCFYQQISLALVFNHTSYIECWHIRLQCPSSSMIIPQTSLASFISSTIENHPSNQYQPRSSALKMNKTDKKLVFRSFRHAININLSQSEYRVDNQFWNGAEMVASKPTPNHHEMRRRRCLPQALDARCLLKDQWQIWKDWKDTDLRKLGLFRLFWSFVGDCWSPPGSPACVSIDGRDCAPFVFILQTFTSFAAVACAFAVAATYGSTASWLSKWMSEWENHAAFDVKTWSNTQEANPQSQVSQADALESETFGVWIQTPPWRPPWSGSKHTPTYYANRSADMLETRSSWSGRLLIKSHMSQHQQTSWWTCR